jgi:hypothetical protein
MECRPRRKDGTTRVVERNSQVIEFADHAAILVQAVDVTEKHSPARAVQASEPGLRGFVGKLAEGLLLHDEQRRLL